MSVEKEIVRLQEDLDKTLLKAERQRKILRIAKMICYGFTLLYFLFIISIFTTSLSQYFFHDYNVNPNPTFWEANPILIAIIPIFVLIYISGAIFPYASIRFTKLEQSSVQQIMERLFPAVKCTLRNIPVKESLLTNSLFFSKYSMADSACAAYSSLIIDTENRQLKVYDLGVVGNKKSNLLTGNPISGSLLLLKQLLRFTFSSRIENSMTTFRGMFAHAKLPKTLQGSVVILPDKLTTHLDFMAHTIQSMKNIAGNKLVRLEDPEFERYFAVYSTDEVLARYVLTPLMMQQMTALRVKYDRDIMLSFNGNTFYFSVSMPEGLLTLGNKSVKEPQVVRSIYDNVLAAQSILKNLRLD